MIAALAAEGLDLPLSRRPSGAKARFCRHIDVAAKAATHKDLHGMRYGFIPPVKKGVPKYFAAECLTV